jgi:hypothetical protein
LLRLVVAINNKTQQRQRRGLLHRQHVVLLNNLSPPERPSRSHPPPAERVLSLATETPVPEPPATGTPNRYFVVGVHWRQNADARTLTKMSLSSAFFRWRSDGNERRQQYANDRYFVAMSADNRHAKTFPWPGADECCLRSFCCGSNSLNKGEAQQKERKQINSDYLRS